jgi:RNA polymerase sigma factor (TIGR02999 family)
LRDWSAGDAQAARRLLPLVYDDLRRTARAFARRERRSHTLSPTAVVHEAWIQLIGSDVQFSEVAWQSREHFLGVAARRMRRILIDYARRRCRAKRGGGLDRVPLFDSSATADATREDTLLWHLAIDRALHRLELFAPQDARIVELRYFGGLTLEETAEYLGVSRRTVVRCWRRARAWLLAELEEGTDPGP